MQAKGADKCDFDMSPPSILFEGLLYGNGASSRERPRFLQIGRISRSGRRIEAPRVRFNRLLSTANRCYRGAQSLRCPAHTAQQGKNLTTDLYRPLKDALGRFATGVAVAACRNARGGYTALTVNSFTSVSLDPPLVLWCIERRASSFDDFAAAASYSISILTDAQQSVSERFARHVPAPLAAGEFEVWKSGAPILAERLAGFDCEIIDRHRSGDHVILVARVIQFDSRAGAPLLYFASRYASGPGAN